MNKDYIVIDGLKKNKAGKVILKDVDITIEQNKIFTLLGSNGAGKTTLASILATLSTPSRGIIAWKGKNIATCLNEYRSILGYCPQHTTMHRDLTVYQNLYALSSLYNESLVEAKNAAEKMIEMFSLQDHTNKLPSEISGGVRQRALIARALVHNPEFVILDEPTVALDPRIRRTLWKIVQQLKDQGVTVLLTTHYLDEAEILSDKIVVMNKGSVVSVLTPDEMKVMYSSSSLENAFIEFLKELENQAIEE